MKHFGIDVASQRADDLDKLLLSEISRNSNLKVLDIGSGALGQSFRMAEEGAKVTAIDTQDQTHRLQEKLSTIKFIHGDALDIIPSLASNSYDTASLQRMIHYLPYLASRQLLKELHRILTKSLYISVTGIESDIGRFYLNSKDSIEKRFSTLSLSEQETFSITEPMCLYSKAEFNTLLESAGWNIKKIWTSSFGNHKAICSKTKV